MVLGTIVVVIVLYAMPYHEMWCICHIHIDLLYEHRSNPPGHPHRAGESLAPLAYEPIGPEDVMEG